MNTVLDLSEFRMRCKTMSGGSWIKLLEHYADPAIDLEPGKDYMELNPVTNRFRVRYYSYSGHFVRDTSCNYYEVIRKLGYRVQEMTGLYWLGQSELAQSIPPQYTKYIGEQLMVALSLHCR